MDFFLRLLGHFLEAFDQSVALSFSTEAGEREADIPLSGEIVEGKHAILVDRRRCDHGSTVFVDPEVVIAALVVQELSV